MEDSDSHAQKVLIHSLAMDDPDLMALMESPDALTHVSHQDSNLHVDKHDRATASPFELLMDDSVGHSTRVVMHSVSTLPDNEISSYGPIVPETM